VERLNNFSACTEDNCGNSCLYEIFFLSLVYKERGRY
jgi:hypothetical protein